jgi:epoxyqueuosine reductase QueG
MDEKTQLPASTISRDQRIQYLVQISVALAASPHYRDDNGQLVETALVCDAIDILDEVILWADDRK